jgi:DNA polymerase I
MNTKLHLIDATAYIFRAYYGLRSLTAPDSTPTNAVYGYSQMLLKIVKDAKQDLIAAVFDAKGPSFRKELYKEYKANRQPAPDDLIVQIPLCIELTRLMGIPVYTIEGVEADDVIATLATRGKEKDMEIVIHSADKDLMQLVDGKTSLYDSMRKKLYDELEVEKKHGVPPSKIGDLLALMGDASDNIPGIKGIGKKTAAKLLNEYGDLDSILKAGDTIKGKLGERIRQGVEDARFSRILVELKINVPLEGTMQELCTPHSPIEDELKTLLKRLGFQRVVKQVFDVLGIQESKTTETQKKIETDNAPTASNKETPESTVKTNIAENYSKGQLIGVSAIEEFEIPQFPDGITLIFHNSTVSHHTSEPDGITIHCHATQNTWHFPFVTELFSKPLDTKVTMAKLKPMFEDENIEKTIYLHKNAIESAKIFEIEIRGIIKDPLICSYLEDPSRRSHALDELILSELDSDLFPLEDKPKKGKKPLKFSELPLDSKLIFAHNQAKAIRELSNILCSRMMQRSELETIYNEIEIPLTNVLAKIEAHGVLLDQKLLSELESEAGGKMLELEERVQKTAGYAINLNSPKQLQKFLFEEQNCVPLKKTKTGFSTDAETLEVLSFQYEEAEWIHQYRQLAKLMGTYITALPRLINPKTGRVHTHFNQDGAATGRLSSSNPNLQNIPIRTPFGRRIREAFIAPSGFKLLSLDYSQIELRVLAHLSGDSSLIEAFKKGLDIHSITASEIFEIPLEEVESEKRRIAKAVNFGVVYGQTPFGLSKTIHIPMGAAKEYIEAYFKRYPSIKTYMDKVIEDSKTNGYASTMSGRRRPLVYTKRTRAAVERMAQNTPIQGSAADIIKIAMIQCDDLITRKFPNIKMILTVHDELIFELPDDQVEEFTKQATKVMESVVKLDVPLKVDGKAANNWSAAH